MKRLVVIMMICLSGCISNPPWEAPSVFRYDTLNDEETLQHFYVIGHKEQLIAVGSLAYEENGKNTWLFWGKYKELIGEDIQIMAKKQGGKEEINALKEYSVKVEKGIMGAEAHATGTIQLPDEGLWRLSFVHEERVLDELVVKITKQQEEN